MINKITIFIAVAVLSSSITFANNIRSQLLQAADNDISGEYVRQRFLQVANVPFTTTENKKKALIIGDSHAQDFFNSVLESNALTQYQLRTRYIPTGCQPLIDENSAQYILVKDQLSCEKADNLHLAKEQIAQADLVILVANWKEWSAKQLPATIEALKLNDDQKLIIIGRKSFGKPSIRRYLRMSEQKLLSLRNKPDGVQIKINTLMKNTLSSDVFVDLQHIICDSQETCPVFTKDAALISFDGGHLTKEGAKYVGMKLFQYAPLSLL